MFSSANPHPLRNLLPVTFLTDVITAFLRDNNPLPPVSVHTIPETYFIGQYFRLISDYIYLKTQLFDSIWFIQPVF